MNTIQPATVTDIQVLRAATLRLITTMVDTEHRPVPHEIRMLCHNGPGLEYPRFVLRVYFDDPAHVNTWAGLERAEGYPFEREQQITEDRRWETFEARLITQQQPTWHGWHHIYFIAMTRIPSVTPEGVL